MNSTLPSFLQNDYKFVDLAPEPGGRGLFLSLFCLIKYNDYIKDKLIGNSL